MALVCEPLPSLWKMAITIEHSSLTKIVLKSCFLSKYMYLYDHYVAHYKCIFCVCVEWKSKMTTIVVHTLG